jgi:hypothetical protein
MTVKQIYMSCSKDRKYLRYKFSIAENWGRMFVVFIPVNLLAFVLSTTQQASLMLEY